MKSIINPHQSDAKLASVLRTVTGGNQLKIQDMDIHRALKERLITSQIVWDHKYQKSVAIYRMMDAGRSWLSNYNAATVH